MFPRRVPLVREPGQSRNAPKACRRNLLGGAAPWRACRRISGQPGVSRYFTGTSCCGTGYKWRVKRLLSRASDIKIIACRRCSEGCCSGLLESALFQLAFVSLSSRETHFPLLWLFCKRTRGPRANLFIPRYFQTRADSYRRLRVHWQESDALKMLARRHSRARRKLGRLF